MKPLMVLAIALWLAGLAQAQGQCGYFYGDIDGNSLPLGTDYFVVYVYDSDQAVEWYSSYIDGIPGEYQSPYMNIQDGPFDLQCRVYNSASQMIGEKWVYDVELPGGGDGVEVNFWFGS